MLRLDRVEPLRLPGFLGAGVIHGGIFLAREGGIHYVRLGPSFILNGSASQPLNPPPYMWGATISVKADGKF